MAERPRSSRHRKQLDLPPPPKIHRRTVLYVPGFDPKGAARYRALYRSEARRWTKLFGGEMALGKPTSDGFEMRWRIEATLPAEEERAAAPVAVDYVVLGWDDLVVERMSAPLLWRMLRATNMFFAMIREGSLYGMVRQAWIPVVVTTYPFLFVLGYLTGAIGAAIGVPLLLSALTGVATIWLAPLGLLAGWGVLKAAERVDGRTMALYLVDLYTLVRALARGNAPQIEARIDAFADRIIAASKARESDEILVVGHSGGGQLATSAVARALAHDLELARRGAEIGLLTLGQFLSAQMQFPDGVRHHEEYKAVARSTELTWVDVSALSDAVCYGLCDPLAATRGALPSSERRSGPKVVSAAFKDTMATESFAKIENNHFRRHFQYLYVFEKPGAFDYFRITAGPLSLAERFAAIKSNRRVPPTAAEIAAPKPQQETAA